MHEKGIIKPISVSTFLVRQGLGLPGENEEFIDASEGAGEEERSLDEIVSGENATEKDEAKEKPLDEIIAEDHKVDDTKTSESMKSKEAGADTEESIDESADETSEPPEEKKKADPKDEFVAEVESLLKKDKTSKEKKAKGKK